MTTPAEAAPAGRGEQYLTERLRLRPLSAGDEAAVLRLLSDERVVRWMLFPLFTPEHARSFVERALARRAADPPTTLVLAMEPREGGAAVGLCGLVLSGQPETGEAWYLLDPALWGRGLAGEAVEALLEAAFRGLGLHRVWATASPRTPPAHGCWTGPVFGARATRRRRSTSGASGGTATSTPSSAASGRSARSGPRPRTRDARRLAPAARAREHVASAQAAAMQLFGGYRW